MVLLVGYSFIVYKFLRLVSYVFFSSYVKIMKFYFDVSSSLILFYRWRSCLAEEMGKNPNIYNLHFIQNANIPQSVILINSAFYLPQLPHFPSQHL